MDSSVCDSVTEVLALLKRKELSQNVEFVTCAKDKDYGKIDWNGCLGKEILWDCKGKPFDGVPMCMVGRLRLRCRHGPCKGKQIVSQLSNTCHSLDKRVMTKITELVTGGVVKVAEVLGSVKGYLASEIFPGQPLPDESNRRYWPSNKTVLNCIYRTKIHNRQGSCDEANVHQLLEKWKSGDDDIVEFNMTDDESLDGYDNDVVFFHQSKWQRQSCYP